MAATLISLGALVAITSVVLTVLYGQTRIIVRDVPRRAAAALAGRKASRAPARRCGITVVFGVAGAIGRARAADEIAKLVNIGTLFAFVIVNIGVIVLRRTRPDLERGFRVPLVPVFPLIGAALCIFLMTKLEATTWMRFGVWMVLGLVIYFVYGRSHSRLRQGRVENPEADLG